MWCSTAASFALLSTASIAIPLVRREREESITDMSASHGAIQARTEAEMFASEVVHIGFLCTKDPTYLTAVKGVSRQIVGKTTASIIVHVLTDLGVDLATLKSNDTHDDKVTFEIHDLRANNIATTSQHLKAFYDSPWMYKVMTHEILPSLDRIILLDLDIVVVDDIRSLWKEFDLMTGSQMFGFAFEQQPTYSKCETNLPNDFKKEHFDRKGFNGGVQLLDLKKIRNDTVFKAFIASDISSWVTKQELAVCKGFPILGRTYSEYVRNLGDQSFHTYLAASHAEWYHLLPCRWNVQLCDFFNVQFNLWPPAWPETCSESPSLVHANGNDKQWFMQADYGLPSCALIKQTLSAKKNLESLVKHLCG